MFWPANLTHLKHGIFRRTHVLLRRALGADAPQIAWAVALPAASMLLGDSARDLYLMALEALIAVGAIAGLLSTRGPKRRSRRELQWALLLCGLGGADLIYNLPGPGVPRYPRNHVADMLLLAVVVALIVMAARGWQRRMHVVGVWAAWLIAIVSLRLQVAFVVGPLMLLPAVPALAVFDAWLYAALCSVLLGILLVRSCRAINRQEHLAAQGLLLMLASDFAQRHDAITTVGAMGWGEAGWAAGLGLLAIALKGGKGELPWRASSPQAPWRSARCALGGLTFVGNVVLLGGALWGDLLAVTEGAQLTALLWLVWIGWFVSNALAVRLHEAMERIGALMPAPHITWCQAQHPMTVALKPITPRTRLAEFDGWVARYNQLVNKLNPLIAQVSRHQEAFAYQQMAEHVAHDIRAPVAALQSALDALEGREAEPARILSQAAARIQDVAQTLLNARRHLGYAHPRRHTHGHGHAHAHAPVHPKRPLAQSDPAQVRPPVALDPHDTAPLGRIFEVVQRDLGLRHGQAWAEAVVMALEPCEVRAPLTAVVAALGNLLDNSIEATPIGPGAVRVTAVRGAQTLELHVVDRGAGMPRHVLDALGKRSITAGKRDGNGLGVLGAAQAARAWGGTLTFALPVQGGTTAVLTIPLVQAPALPVMAATPDVTVLVDDDPLVRAAWQLSAQHAGAHLVTFSSSAACLKGIGALSHTTQFYLDTQLGGDMTGHDLARVLLSMGFGQVVVMQSAGGGGAAPFGPDEPAPYPIAASKRAPFAARKARAA